MYWLKPHVVLSPPPLFSDIFSCSGPLFPNLLYLNTVFSSIQPNLIITYHCVHLYSSNLLSAQTHSNHTSNPCPTPVWLPSNLVSNTLSKIVGHTCILYKWAQHTSWSQVLFHYPLLISHSDLVLLQKWLLTPEVGSEIFWIYRWTGNIALKMKWTSFRVSVICTLFNGCNHCLWSNHKN